MWYLKIHRAARARWAAQAARRAARARPGPKEKYHLKPGSGLARKKIIFQARLKPSGLPVGLEILSVPASSASIERAFSIAALSCGTKNRRARLGEIKMGQETLISVNDSFLEL